MGLRTVGHLEGPGVAWEEVWAADRVDAEVPADAGAVEAAHRRHRASWSGTVTLSAGLLPA